MSFLPEMRFKKILRQKIFYTPFRIPFGRQYPALPRVAQGKAAAACTRLLKSQEEDWQRARAADQSLSTPLNVVSGVRSCSSVMNYLYILDNVLVQ